MGILLPWNRGLTTTTMSLFARLFQYQSHAQGLVLVKEKLLINFISVTSFFSLFYIAVSGIIGYLPGVYIMSCNFLLFLLNLFLFVRKFTPYRVAAHFYMANCALVAIMLCTFFSGGLYSPVLPWFILIPTVSLLLLGIGRSTWVWLIMVMAIVVTFGVLKMQGFVYPFAYELQWMDFFTITCITGLILIVYLVTMMFERARETALVELAVTNKEMMDSIYYAQRIQNRVLAPAGFIDRYFSESFIIFKPKDIVSGDFYWAAEKNNFMYLAVCDCTGHGVPGAFMSLLTSGFLNEAVNERGIEKPNQVFDFVRSKLVENGSRDGTRDGMDGILLCMDKANGKLTYAAANNSPVLIRNHKLVKLPKDKMPVGIGEKKEPFSLFDLDTQKGDMLYLYTDGFTDLFGGPKGKKFTAKQLNHKLEEISAGHIQGQRLEIEKTFMQWKGEWEQVDDMSMMAIRI